MNDIKTRILKHDTAVPRYTSYPTAPQFKEEFPAGTVAEWMRAIPDGQSISLYLHIPFCRQMCWYCGCHTKITQRYAPVEDYLHLLLREIDMVGDTIGRKQPVNHIHFGGGSPTMLTAQDMRAVMERIHKNFSVNKDAEIAIEIDPRTVNRELIELYAELGFNRASLGVQDFDRTVLRAVNRDQTFATVYHVAEGLRNVGIKALNFDFIYGLPHQNLRTMVKAMDLALTMEPDRFALFGYAHVPWMKKHITQMDYDALPQPDLRYDLFEAASGVLVEAGYAPIGIDHFAKPDDTMAIAAKNHTLHRNFQGYTVDACNTLIGLGASAISQFAQGYSQNTPHNNLYGEALLDTRLPTAKGLVLTDDDRMRRSIIEQIMCHGTVDLATYNAGHLMAGAWDRLAPLAHDQLVTVEGTKITLPPEARIAVRMVASAFDAYLPTSAEIKRHAQAV